MNFCVVLDNDAKGNRTRATLEQDFSLKLKIQMVSDNKDEEIEDLFASEDFSKHVLNEKLENLPTGKANSWIIKQKGKSYDKALLAKSFYENVLQGKISLSTDTNNRITKLLNRINNLMFP